MRLAPALLAVVMGGAVAAASPTAYDGQRAALAQAALQHTFFDGKQGLYRDVAGRPAIADAWPYSQALAATIALAQVPHAGRRYVRVARARIAALARYARGDGARRIFRVVTGAWDSDPSHPCAGGVFWTTVAGNHDRNTVTTATGALLAMRLYGATHASGYLVWARRMLAWAEQCMASPNGLLWDHIDLRGRVDRTEWSYNQGTAIGAYVLLYRLVGDRTALARAEELADASLRYFDENRLRAEPPFFLAIFFRNLLSLGQAAHDPRCRAAAQAYADGVWTDRRDPRTGLVAFHAGAPARLLEQSALVQLYAALAQPHSVPGA
ncbi:MAG: glycosyl hydrolase [Actinobacteria bacterium]|nr:MAG: glycosyl hydrolase [Actinomycetota bacterium]